ncbi:MAG TPA: sensor domain-containing diguanylate cyclase [Anaerovoracaceae bacterium]|nr:sensor domain-containing diguanylate cyclase [Anaerovoracaceae bacterium]
MVDNENRIKELEALVEEFKKEKDESELLEFPWVGNLGQWYWSVQTNKVIFNNNKITNMGFDRKELPKEIGFEFFTNRLHPNDYERVMANMRSHLYKQSDIYEVEYRIKNKEGKYIWYYDRGKVTKRDEEGRPILVSGIVFDISKNKELEQELLDANHKLNEMVITDELTGAFNRRYLTNKLSEEIERSERTNELFSLIMFDIDHFKRVNDVFGHDCGDVVLKTISNLVKDRIRKIDSFCRWGGEEFIILIPNTDKNSAYLLAEEIRKIIANSKMEGIDSVTASFGVTNFLKSDNPDTIVKRADDLMYLAKIQGRNCVKM